MMEFSSKASAVDRSPVIVLTVDEDGEAIDLTWEEEPDNGPSESVPSSPCSSGAPLGMFPHLIAPMTLQ